MNEDNSPLPLSTALSTTLSKTLSKPVSTSAARMLVLSVPIFVAACASTGGKPDAETQIEDQTQAQTTQQEAEPAGKSAEELMQTLQAPLVEPGAPKAPQKAQQAAEKPKTKVVQAKPETKASEVKVAVEQKVEPKVEQAEVKAAPEKIVKQETAPVAEKEQALAVSKPVSKVQPAPGPVNADLVSTAPVSTGTVASEPSAPVSASVSRSMPGVEPFNVTARQVPFSYDIWTIKKGDTPLTQGLVISTPTWEMGKEGYMSQIWLTLMEDKIHVNSSSDIETASRGMGIRIDGGNLIPFSSIEDNKIGVINGSWLEQLAKANKVEVYLGFFPGKKPTSETFSSELVLDNLLRVVATYRMLNR